MKNEKYTKVNNSFFFFFKVLFINILKNVLEKNEYHLKLYLVNFMIFKFLIIFDSLNTLFDGNE